MARSLMHKYRDREVFTPDSTVHKTINDTPCTSASQKRMMMAEDVVVSGMSGKLPQSDHLAEFWDNLINAEDMITEENSRWDAEYLSLPKRSGKVRDLSKFDATFFGISSRQSDIMDAQLRILLETTWEAIMDAGVNPESIRGSKTAVFIGASVFDAFESSTSTYDTITGLEMVNEGSMLANRISYHFDFKGPSYTLNSACSSSMMCLHNALRAIRSGECDAAIVGACNVNLNACSTKVVAELGALSYTTSKSFDADTDGYTRSDGIAVMLLQRGSDARRIYSHLIHTKCTSHGYRKQGIHNPSQECETNLMRDFYKECGLSPSCISYVESHSTGTQMGDIAELNAITDVFCQDREQPLLIGSVKSNLGHTETTSGLVSLIKVILSMKASTIAPNLHYSKPNPQVPGLVDGRLKVVTQPLPWQGQYAAINAFGIGGTYSHVVVRRPDVASTHEQHLASGAVRLATASGRTKQETLARLDLMKSQSDNVYLQTLLQWTSNVSPQLYPYRGFTVLNSKHDTKDQVQEVPGSHLTRPVWYIFPGMGCQWLGMGSALMELEVCRETLHQCHSTLQEYGVDLVDIITSSSCTMGTLEATIGTTAIQIALVETLRTMGLTPNGMIGHSFGEITCGYAAGSLTLKQAMEVSYWRSKCIIETDLPPGGMAAVGLSWNEARSRCPEGVVPACHNAEDSVTVSGPKDKIDSFVAEMEKEGVFVRNVNSAGVAFHSPAMQQIAPLLEEKLKQVLQSPVKRSERWVSSCIPEPDWGSSTAQSCSAGYFIQNLISPVLFHEALAHVPPSAVVIEIAPHGLLQAILKRSLGSNTLRLSLMKKHQSNNKEALLSAFAKCYMSGLNLNPLNLHEAIELPVPADTSILSPLFNWQHERSWAVPMVVPHWEKRSSGDQCQAVYELDVSAGGEYRYLREHTLDRRVIFPATGLIFLAWKTLARHLGRKQNELPFILSNFHIKTATLLPQTEIFRFEVSFLPSSGDFEIFSEGKMVATGRIKDVKNTPNNQDGISTISPMEQILEKEEVYKEMHVKGYGHVGTFAPIRLMAVQKPVAILEWTGNWITFLDGCLCVTGLSLNVRAIVYPKSIAKLTLNPNLVIASVPEDKGVTVWINQIERSVNSEGIKMTGMEFSIGKRNPQRNICIEEETFVPYQQHNVLFDEGLHTYLEDCLAAIHYQKEQNNQDEQRMSDIKSKYKDDVEAKLIKILIDKEDSELDNSNICTTDKLLSHLLNVKALVPAMSIAVENLVNGIVDIVEVSPGGNQIYNTLKEWLETRTSLVFTYRSCLNSSQVCDENVAHINWDLNAEPPSDLKGDIIILNNALHKYKHVDSALSHLKALTKEGSFVLVLEPTINFPIAACANRIYRRTSESNGTYDNFAGQNEWIRRFEEMGLQIVAQTSDDLLSTLFLLRKKDNIVEEKNITEINVDGPDISWFDNLRDSVLSEEERPEQKLWVVSQNIPHSGIQGLVRCLIREEGGPKRIRCLFDPQGQLPDGEKASIMRKDLYMNIYKDGKLGCYFGIPTGKYEDMKVESRHAYCSIAAAGSRPQLRWLTSGIEHTVADGGRIISVFYSSLNTRDAMLARGRLSSNICLNAPFSKKPQLGMEFSGIDENSNRVMGLVNNQALATVVQVPDNQIWKVPNTWTMEDAATVPVAYCTSYYSLVMLGHIGQGDIILIHDGSGSIGQAAIHVALKHGCVVFTTYGNLQQKELIMQSFPQIPSENICTFFDISGILEVTKGYGVDLILNTLTGEGRNAGLELLSQGRKFINVVQTELNANTADMPGPLENISYVNVNLQTILKRPREWQKLYNMVLAALNEGALVPLKTKVFEKKDIIEALSSLMQGTNMGTPLIRVNDTLHQNIQTALVEASPKVHFNPNKSYIVTGGLGGMGLEFIQWMIQRGARHFLITTRSGVKRGYQSRKLRQWRQNAIDIQIENINITESRPVELLIKAQQHHLPVGGMFHLSGMLFDGALKDQTRDIFRNVISVKEQGLKNLDICSQKYCSDSLDWFVVFSSITSMIGAHGQTPYGFANSAVDRICELRRQSGQPALAIQWGAISDVGMSIKYKKLQERLGMSMFSALSTLDHVLHLPSPVVTVNIGYNPVDMSNAKADVKMRIFNHLQEITGIRDLQHMDDNMDLVSLGVDSMSMVELRQVFQYTLRKDMLVQEIEQLKLKELKSMIEAVNV